MFMKILMCAVCDRPESTNVGQKEAFEKLGHQVECFNHRTILQSRNLNETFELYKSRMQRFDPDIVMFCKTNELDIEFIQWARRTATTVYWFPDPLATAMGFHASEMAAACDKAFATSTPVVEYFNKLGADCKQLIEGYRPDIYYWKDCEKSIDVSFVGNWSKEREATIGSIRESGVHIDVFGNWPSRFNAKSAVYLDDERNVYLRSKLVLNLVQGNIFSDRVVKALACGAQVVTERCDDLIHFDFVEYCIRLKTEQIVRFLKEVLKKHLSTKTPGGFFVAEKQLQMIEQFTWEKQMRKLLEKI